MAVAEIEGRVETLEHVAGKLLPQAENSNVRLDRTGPATSGSRATGPGVSQADGRVACRSTNGVPNFSRVRTREMTI